MKALNPRIKQCFAWVLIFVLVLTNLNLVLAMQDPSERTDAMTAGELVANKYGLSEGEKALLSSGLLAGDSFTYTAPGNDDGLVVVDTESKTVTAADYTDGGYTWKPATAEIVVDGRTYETIVLAEGNQYTYNGKAFSVHVTYELYLTVDAEIQANLLNTAGWLKQGIANMETIRAQLGSLGLLEEAMPQLLDLALNGIVTSLAKVTLSEEGVAAVLDLSAEMDANGGHLNLSVIANAYDRAVSETEYLLTKGLEAQAEAVGFMSRIGVLHSALSILAANVDTFVKYDLIDQSVADQLKILSGSVNDLNTALSPLVAESADWTAAVKGTALVKSDITAAGYQTLDWLVASLGDTIHTSADFAIQESLLAAVAVVQSNMSMKNVSVVVKLQVVENVVNSAALIPGGEEHTVTLTMNEGVSLDEIAAAVAVSGIETSARNSWERYVEGQFEPSVTIVPEISSLNEDITYIITYSPKMYTVSFGGDFGGASDMRLPYGYQMMLPINEDATKVYDYFVNGTYYAQGSVYTIAGDTTITRESGKRYTDTNLYTVIANNFATEKEKLILTSGALLGNEMISVRYPDSDNGSLVSMEGDVLTAETCKSDYAGKIWMPYSYTVISGSEKAVYHFNGETSVTVSETAYDSISVVYRLVLDHFEDARVLKTLQLPEILVNEAAAQKAVLDELGKSYGSMAQLNKTNLMILGTVIDYTDLVPKDPETGELVDPEKNAELKEYFNAIVDDIAENCIDSDGNLKIYNMLGAYLKADGGGLAYYYANGAAILNEIDLLSSYLSRMLADEEKIAAVELLVIAAGKPEFADRISGIEQTMNDARAMLVAPNAAIDASSGNLSKLVDALNAEGETNVYAAVPEPGKLSLLSGEFVMAASTKAAVKVTLELAGEPRTISVTYDKGHTLTQADIDGIKAEIAASLTEVLGENARYYDNNYGNGAGLDALVGTALRTSQNFAYIWTAKIYTVLVEGGGAQTITIDNLQVNLPASERPGVRYDYIVDGSVVSSGWYTFTLEQIDRLFTTGSYSISRLEVNEGREKLENMVAQLNNDVQDGSFVLTEENGRYIGLTANVGMEGMMGMVMGLVTSGYDYVGLNYEGLVYMPEVGGLEISLQTVVDALLHDETFTSQTLIDLAANGGGRFLSTTMQLGETADQLEQDLAFEIVLTSVSADLVSAGNALAGMEDQLTFRAGGGRLNMEMSLSESDYTSCLSGLIMTGHLSVSDVNELETLVAYQFLESYIKALFGGDVTTTTLANTAAGLGQDLDPAEQEDYFQQLKNILGSDNLVSTADGYVLAMITPAGELNASLELMIPDPAMLNNVKNLVKECKPDGSLVVDVTVEITNFADEDGNGMVDNSYEAVVLTNGDTDHAVTSLSGMILTDDIVQCAESLPAGAVIILQKDVKDDLYFKDTAALDLNGHTVMGNVTADGMLVIYDSTMDSSASGGVTGSVAGRNEEDIYVLAGTYSSDVSPYLEPGSIQDLTGTVVNNLFTVTEQADGSIVIDVNAGMLSLDVQPSRTLANMSLLPKFMMRYGIAGSMTVNGTSAVTVNLEDMFAAMADGTAMSELLLQLNNEGVEIIVNNLLADLLDFAAVKTAIELNRPVHTETVITAPLALTLVHDRTEDCLDLLVTAGEEREPVTITVRVAGEQGEKDALAALNNGLSNTVDTTVTVNVETVEGENGTAIESSYDAVMVVDLTKNGDYAAILGVMLAHSGVSKDAFVPALETYFRAGDASELKSVLAGITFDQLTQSIMEMEKSVSFTAMAANIGLAGNVSRAAELEAVYHNFLAGIGREMTNGEPVTDDQTLGEDGIFVVVEDTTTGGATSGEGAAWDELFREQEPAPYTLHLTIKVFGDCTHIHAPPVEENRVEATCQTEGSYDEVVYCMICRTELSREKKIIEKLTDHSHGDWTCVDENTHEHTCSVCGESETAPHSYSGDSDATCNDCGYERTIETPDPGPVNPDPGPGPVNPGPGPVNPGPGLPGIGGNLVNSSNELKTAIANARDGAVITIGNSFRMVEDIYVNRSITIRNAANVDTAGYVFRLTNTGAGITSDSGLNVGSDMDGYRPIRRSDTYTLTEITAPKTGGAVAGSKVEKLQDSRYLFLDLDPSNGMTLSALSGEAVYTDLDGYTLKFTVSGNDGSGLVKTGDRLVVSAWNNEGGRVAQITCVVIVMGDTNCNGKVNTSDATVLKNISLGQTYSFEVRMAADANFSGSLETPKVNSSDVAYIMGKWFAWDANKYVSNMK